MVTHPTHAFVLVRNTLITGSFFLKMVLYLTLDAHFAPAPPEDGKLFNL